MKTINMKTINIKSTTTKNFFSTANEVSNITAKFGKNIFGCEARNTVFFKFFSITTLEARLRRAHIKLPSKKS